MNAVHVLNEKNYDNMITRYQLATLTSSMAQTPNARPSWPYLGSHYPLYEAKLQSNARGARAVLKLTGTLSTRGLADKNVTNCTHCQDSLIGRVTRRESVA